MIRLGLCCKFAREPIRFRTATATALLKMPRSAALAKISGICRANALALREALAFCAANNIGAFRVNSQILPVKTHPDAGYDISGLPDADDIIKSFKSCGRYARCHNLRLSFHPDQFILLSSPEPGITARSIADLEYHTDVAEWIGADVINIHGGGAYGDKAAALDRVARVISRLPARIRKRLTLENDDKTYTPSDLLPVCHSSGIPLVYDVHHHRCNPDSLTIEKATKLALATWNREPLFHVSSPKDGWNSPQPYKHHDYINPTDFPVCWKKLSITIEVEAKAKELAIAKLQQELQRSNGEVGWWSGV